MVFDMERDTLHGHTWLDEYRVLLGFGNGTLQVCVFVFDRARPSCRVCVCVRARTAA